MKIAVMGAGALGGYFGGRLAAAGADVSFIARGAHLAALKAEGLRVESPLGDLHLPQVKATEDPAEIGPVDLVLFLVKLPDTRAAARALAPLLGPETGVLSLQNGVEAWGWIGEEIGAGRVMGGTAQIPADIRAPGVIRHSGPFARVAFGEFGGAETGRARALLAAFEAAGVEVSLAPDIEVKIWEKFVMLSAFSALTALTRLPIGPVRENPETRGLLARAIAETHAVGRAERPALAADYADRAMGFVDAAPAGMRSSMLDDLLRGRPLELAYLSGAVARLGAERGIETPVHDFVAKALSPFASGAPKA
ncbi:MAG: 2-dehydropantoate 2-reductase [Pikeienuella sp.]|uniref:2-dehydropantoate 2-reductase n=1 Tax=Pikeienuella sp. TaxID=2831957 RepID=UPI003918C62B